MTKGTQRLFGSVLFLIASNFLTPCIYAQGRGAYAAGINYPAGPPTVPTNTNFWLGGILPVEIHYGDFNGDGKMDVVVAAACSGPYYPACPANGSAVVVYLSNGDGTFQDPIVSGGNIPPTITSLVVGDFNGDGKLDVAAAADCLSSQDCSAGTVTILLGNGDGTFTQSSQYALNGILGHSNTMAVGRFSSHGNLDLVVGIECYNIPVFGCAEGSISVYPGNGDGTLGAPTSYPTVGNSPLFPVVGDFNGDGKLDIIAGSAVSPVDNSQSSLSVLLGNGDGSFGAQPGSPPVVHTFAGLVGLSALAAADFNADGKLDLAITSTSTASLYILTGDGLGSFLPSSTTFAVNLGNSITNGLAVAVADLNGDGATDVIISGTFIGNNGVQIFLNDGAGNFAAGSAYGLGGWLYAAFVAQDFNGDGKIDIVMASGLSEDPGPNNHNPEGTISVLLGNGDGTMQGAKYLGPNSIAQSNSIVSADVNGDGIPDLIQASFYFGQDQSQGGVAVSLGTGNGNYAPPIFYATGSPVSFWVVAGDFNGDGKIDLAVANACSDGNCTQGGVAILLGNGDGTLQAPTVYGSGAPDALALATGDFNGDGKLDVAVMNQVQPPSVSILLGNGDGTLQPAVLTDTSAGVSSNYSIATGDFNRDGKTDVALGSLSNESAGIIRIYLSNGDGTLTQAGDAYASGGTFYGSGGLSLAVGDVNGDGNLDVVAANGCQLLDSGCGYGSLGVLLGSGAGTFQAGQLLNVPDGNSYSLLLADVTGDGILDAVATNLTGVEVFPGNGDGSFQMPIVYAGISTGGENISLALADLNILQPALSGGTIAVLVNKGGTYLVTKSSANPAAGNENIQLTTNVTASYLTGVTPTGSVSYFDGTTFLGSAGLVSGAASFNISGLSQGVHSIIAYYSGDSNFNAHYGTPLLQVITGASAIATTTTASSSLNPSAFGQAITLTATVAPEGPGTPTGTVTFKDGANTLGIGTVSGGTATLVTSALTLGANSITAAYGGDSTFSGSASSPLAETVNRATSSVAIASSANPSSVGQTVMLTIVVSPEFSGTPTGNVTLKKGGATVTTLPLSNGQATYATSSLALGTSSFTAVYSGDADFSGSTSPALKQMVDKITTTTTVTAGTDPVTLGQAVMFTAVVSSNSGTPPDGETVTFKNGSLVLGTGTLSGGSATITTSLSMAGSRAIKASYPGDTTFAPSTSAALTETVDKYNTTSTVVSSGTPSAFGQSVGFTATVVSASGGTATGKVTFKNGNAAIGTQTLSGGTATLNYSALTIGTHSISVVYNGDTNNSSSTSAAISQVVTQAATNTVLASSANPSTAGEAVTFTATVTSSTGATPNGSVTFKSDTKVLGTKPLVGGVASITTSALTVGSHTITATYNGNVDFTGSSTTLTQVVQ